MISGHREAWNYNAMFTSDYSWKGKKPWTKVLQIYIYVVFGEAVVYWSLYQTFNWKIWKVNCLGLSLVQTQLHIVSLFLDVSMGTCKECLEETVWWTSILIQG